MKIFNNNRLLKLLAISIPTVSLFSVLFPQDLKIEIFNKTNYDIDSLSFGNSFYPIKKGTSVFIKNCSTISIQSGLPFGIPEAKIKRKNDGVFKWDLCGTGISEITRGHYKFDIAITEDSNSFILYWKEHQ